MKLVRLIKMCLNKTYSKVHVSKNAFPIQNGLKQGDVLSPMLLNSALGYAARKVQENEEGMELNRIHRILVCVDNINMLGENINVIKKNT